MSEVKLYLGDCLEVMKTLEAGSVDAVVTDPPYGVNYEYENYQDTKENLLDLITSFKIEAKRLSATIAIFTGVKNIGFYGDADWTYAWIVPAGTGVGSHGFTCWTPIAYYGKDRFAGEGSHPDVFVDYKPRRIGTAHPCEKPLSVMLWAIERFTRPGATILDPFMGSGSTAAAAIKLGRNFIGIEIDPGYFEIAKRRIEVAQMQPGLFDAQADARQGK